MAPVDAQGDAPTTAWNSLPHNLIFKQEIVVGGRYSLVADEFSGSNGTNANSIGFDLMKRFTSATGDWASVHLQLRMVYRWNQRPPVPWTEGEDDWELEWHEATLRLTRWLRGKMNFKLGHFDVPFGLEPVVDTHGTLFQLQAMRNVGFKKDWGLSLYGQLPRVDYEASLTTASGMELAQESGAYLSSARVGTPATGRVSIGVSGLYGKVPVQGAVVRRSRAGLDIQFLTGPWTLKSEAAWGRDGGRDIRNAFVELDFIVVPDRMDLVTQVQSTRQDGAPSTGAASIRRTVGVLGLRYRTASAITLELAYERDLHSQGGSEEENVAVQLYAYW